MPFYVEVFFLPNYNVSRALDSHKLFPSINQKEGKMIESAVNNVHYSKSFKPNIILIYLNQLRKF